MPKKKRFTLSETVQALSILPYYETVATCFIEDAIIQAVKDNGGSFSSLSELDSYIRNNLI